MSYSCVDLLLNHRREWVFSLYVRNIVTLLTEFNLSKIVQLYCFCCDVNMDISHVTL